MICRKCGRNFNSRDSLFGNFSLCQDCSEVQSDKAWWTEAWRAQDTTLAMEKIQEVYNQVASAWKETVESTWPRRLGQNAYMRPTGMLVNGMEVYTSRFLGQAVTPDPPAIPKGPYRQRRIKRWRRSHPAYTVGDGAYYLVGNREIWCHPDDLPKLKESLAAACPPGGQS